MKKHVLILSLFIFPFLIHAQQQWTEFTRTNPQAPIIQLVSSDSTEVEFDVEVCGMYEYDTIVNNTTFQRIIIPGGGLFTNTGEPEVPYIRQLIAIPECDSVTLSVTVTDTSVLQDYYVYPAPDFEEVTGQDSIVYIQEVFDFDTTAYNTNQYCPQVNAEIKSIGYFRAQKYAEVFIYPIQFNPVTEEILVNEEYEITLTFVNPSTSINVDVGIFNNIATNTMLNYTSTGVSAIANDNAIENGTVQWVTLTSVNQASNVVGDYLIICSDSLWDSTDPDSEILRIATHRATYNGFDVAILNVENILDLGFEYDDPDFINEQK